MLTPMDHNLCRRYGCEIPVGEGSFLCASHIVKLQDMLDQVPEYLQALAPLQMATNAPRGGQGRSGSGTGSRPPFNLAAWSTWIELQPYANTRAHHIAHHDPDAGRTYKTVASLTSQAYNFINGPEEPTIDRVAAMIRISESHPWIMTSDETCALFESWGMPEINRSWLRRWKMIGKDEGQVILESVGTDAATGSSLFTVRSIFEALIRIEYRNLARESKIA
jgi:hypothetical protein